eukprot:SAG11_NODE_14302_length_617_cov_2.156371_2_plen_43_part_01
MGCTLRCIGITLVGYGDQAWLFSPLFSIAFALLPAPYLRSQSF